MAAVMSICQAGLTLSTVSARRLVEIVKILQKLAAKYPKSLYVKLLQFNVQDPLKAAAAHILALADLSADPCEDFHQFACGNMSSATIPPGKVH